MIGERVRLAREACCLTQQELAEASGQGFTQTKISDIEAGRVTSPVPEDIDAISAATSYPRGFFYLGALPDFPEGYFRKKKKGATKVTRQVRAQVRHIVELVQRSERVLPLPPVRIAPIRNDVDLKAVEALALETRWLLGIGESDPITNLTRAVERAGVVVVRLPTKMEGHDGFSAWPDLGLDGRPIIALSAGHPGDRDRAIVGHELGHLILHSLRPGVESKQAEAEAYRFAGALLLPEAVARKALRGPVTLGVLMGVKAQYGISIAALARRAYELQLINPIQYRSIHKQLSARKWNRVEPVEVTPEVPLLMAKILDELGGRGSIVARAERVHMPVFSFKALLPQ